MKLKNKKSAVDFDENPVDDPFYEMKMKIQKMQKIEGFNYIVENKRLLSLSKEPASNTTRPDRIQSANARRVQIEEDSRKMKIAKSLKWQVIRYRKE